MIREDYIKRLERGGFNRGQAEVQLTVFEDFMQNKVATREDMQRLEIKFEKRFLELEKDIAEIKVDLEKVKFEIKNGFKNHEYRIIMKTCIFMSALAVVFKYFLP